MGLMISPNGGEWSYPGFMRFRRRLAMAEGFDLFRTESYVTKHRDGIWIMPDFRPLHEAHIIRWKDVKTPLRRLFTHSDCEGFLTPKECAKMVDRLEQIVEAFPDGDDDKQEGRKLVAAMRWSVETGKWLEFR